MNPTKKQHKPFKGESSTIKRPNDRAKGVWGSLSDLGVQFREAGVPTVHSIMSDQRWRLPTMKKYPIRVIPMATIARNWKYDTTVTVRSDTPERVIDWHWKTGFSKLNRGKDSKKSKNYIYCMLCGGMNNPKTSEDIKICSSCGGGFHITCADVPFYPTPLCPKPQCQKYVRHMYPKHVNVGSNASVSTVYPAASDQDSRDYSRSDKARSHSHEHDVAYAAPKGPRKWKRNREGDQVGESRFTSYGSQSNPHGSTLALVSNSNVKVPRKNKVTDRMARLKKIELGYSGIMIKEEPIPAPIIDIDPAVDGEGGGNVEIDVDVDGGGGGAFPSIYSSQPKCTICKGNVEPSASMPVMYDGESLYQLHVEMEGDGEDEGEGGKGKIDPSAYTFYCRACRADICIHCKKVGVVITEESSRFQRKKDNAIYTCGCCGLPSHLRCNGENTKIPDPALPSVDVVGNKGVVKGICDHTSTNTTFFCKYCRCIICDRGANPEGSKRTQVILDACSICDKLMCQTCMDHDIGGLFVCTACRMCTCGVCDSPIYEDSEKWIAESRETLASRVAFCYGCNRRLHKGCTSDYPVTGEGGMELKLSVIAVWRCQRCNEYKEKKKKEIAHAMRAEKVERERVKRMGLLMNQHSQSRAQSQSHSHSQYRKVQEREQYQYGQYDYAHADVDADAGGYDFNDTQLHIQQQQQQHQSYIDPYTHVQQQQQQHRYQQQQQYQQAMAGQGFNANGMNVDEPTLPYNPTSYEYPYPHIYPYGHGQPHISRLQLQPQLPSNTSPHMRMQVMYGYPQQQLQMQQAQMYVPPILDSGMGMSMGSGEGEGEGDDRSPGFGNLLSAVAAVEHDGDGDGGDGQGQSEAHGHGQGQPPGAGAGVQQPYYVVNGMMVDASGYPVGYPMNMNVNTQYQYPVHYTAPMSGGEQHQTVAQSHSQTNQMMYSGGVQYQPQPQPQQDTHAQLSYSWTGLIRLHSTPSTTTATTTDVGREYQGKVSAFFIRGSGTALGEASEPTWPVVLEFKCENIHIPPINDDYVRQYRVLPHTSTDMNSIIQIIHFMQTLPADTTMMQLLDQVWCVFISIAEFGDGVGLKATVCPIDLLRALKASQAQSTATAPPTHPLPTAVHALEPEPQLQQQPEVQPEVEVGVAQVQVQCDPTTTTSEGHGHITLPQEDPTQPTREGEGEGGGDDVQPQTQVPVMPSLEAVQVTGMERPGDISQAQPAPAPLPVQYAQY